MALTSRAAKKAVPLRTFNSWQTTFDPEEQWLLGFPPFKGSKNIEKLTCRVCKKQISLQAPNCRNCCKDFVEGKSRLTKQSVEIHAKCANHVLAMQIQSETKEKMEKHARVLEKDKTRAQKLKTRKIHAQALVKEKTHTVRLDIGKKHEEVLATGKNQDHVSTVLNAENNQIQGPLDANNKLQRLGLDNQVQVFQPAVPGEAVTINVEKGTVINDCTVDTINLTYNTTQAPVTDQDIVSSISETLKAAYKDFECCFSLPWLSGGVIDMEDYVYEVPLSVIVYSESGMRLSSKFEIKLENIFDCRGARKPTRILLQSTMGFCTSALFVQLCRDWSIAAGPAANIFDLVVLLDGQKLQTTGLDDLLLQTCFVNGIDNSAILHVIHDNPKVLILINNFTVDSNLAKKKFIPLKRLLRSDIYAKTSVLISSQTDCLSLSVGNRISTLDLDLKFGFVCARNSKACTKWIQFGMMDAKNEWTFFRKNLEKQPLREADLITVRLTIEEIFNQHELWRPLFRLLLVHVLSKTEVESQLTKTNLHKMTIERLCRDYLLKTQTNEAQDVNLFSFDKDCVPFMASLLIKLGKFFLQKFQNGFVTLSREEVLLHFENDPTVLELGLLTFHSNKEGKAYTDVLEPVDPSLIDFVIAYYLWNVYRSQPKELFLSEMDMLKEIEPMEIMEIRKFYAIYIHSSHDLVPKYAIHDFLAELMGISIEELFRMLPKRNWEEWKSRYTFWWEKTCTKRNFSSL